MTTESYILPPFIIDPRYRIWRHLLFVIIGGIITFNQVFTVYLDCIDQLGNRIYPICFSVFLLYAVVIYFNYYFLLPRFLLKNKYLIYLLMLSLIVFLLPALSVLQEYWVRTHWNLPHRVTSYTNPLILIDNLASSMLIVICFLGMSAVVLLRRWIKENEHISLMEYEHLKSEVNKLKGQITPKFLSKTLIHASDEIANNPVKATETLMQLGQLLRYQLYDCNRDKVLLKSEIGFLTKFLYLEQLNHPLFEYRIEQKGDFNHLFIAPLLFITIIQDMIESPFLNLTFCFERGTLYFQCENDGKTGLTDDKVSMVSNQLNLIYPGNYAISSTPGIVELQLNTSE